ncbi:hypothetical protein BFJ71_g9974 [Fusarium oxysporum]|nr:hypothetical protein BFJ71_g9974 [Fusarium oxysporum]
MALQYFTKSISLSVGPLSPEQHCTIVDQCEGLVCWSSNF